MSTDQPHEPALHPHLVVAEDPGFIRRVRSLECDRAALAAKAFQRRLVPVDQRHDDIAVVGRPGFANHHDVAVVDAGVDHRVALHLERVVPGAARDHPAGDRDVAFGVADRLDRDTGGDPAHQRQVDGAGFDRHRVARRVAAVALDHLWGEASGFFQGFRQPDDLDRAGAVSKAANEAAFLQGGDQPVAAGFRAQIQRLFHLVKGRGHPVAFHPLVDEIEQFQLLPGQHGCHPVCVHLHAADPAFGLCSTHVPVMCQRFGYSGM